jgi:type II secretory pathway component PulF
MPEPPDHPPFAPRTATVLLCIVDLSLLGAIVYELNVSKWTAIFWVLVILAGFAFVYVAIRKMGAAGSARAFTIAVVFFIGVLAGGTCVLVPEAIGVVVFALAMAALFSMTWAGATQAMRRRRFLLILGNVEKALRLQMPVGQIVESAARGETGALRNRLLALHDRLERGEQLDQALIHAVPELPRSVARSIAAGLRLGCLEQVLDGILRRRSDEANAYRPSIGFYWAYPVIILGVISFVMVLAIPKYAAILADFHLAPPPATKWLVLSARVFAQTGLGACIILLLAVLFVARIVASLWPARPLAPFGGAVADRLIWWTPIAGNLARDRGMASLCDIVSAGVGAGHGIDESLHQAADAQPNAVMRRRVAAWAAGVSAGQPMHEAARKAGMPEFFAAMLATVRGTQAMEQVLAFLRKHYEYRLSRARAILQAAYVPLVAVFFGAIVAWVAMALLQPMTMLIETLGR